MIGQQTKRLVRRFIPGAGVPRPPSFAESVARAQAAWHREMAPHRNALGIIPFPGYPILEPRHTARARVFPLREQILEQMPKGGAIAELGVQTGDFSAKILEICQPTHLHLIDIDLTRFAVAERFSAQVDAGLVTCHEGDSAVTIAGFPDGHFDFLYIDADHSYDAVKRDIAASVPKIREGGYLVFNDYTFWSSAECMPYGIMQAVNELCIADDWEIVYLAFGWMGYADVAIRRIGAS